MERLKSFLSRPRNAVLVLALVAGVAGGATYAAASRSSSSGGSGDTRSIVIHHATGMPVLTPSQVGAGTRTAAVANVLDADVMIGAFRGDVMSYTGISAQRLAEYSASFDPSQYTVLATAGGRDFYVCSRSGKWYAEQSGVHRSPVATKTPSTRCKL
ncbi:MAG: hypothetical protein QOE29_1443 [Gaiellaceae bacterium]|jgi:hypothetical protein|nr:hypothetical protein [Gaiellaceae bacterium]